MTSQNFQNLLSQFISSNLYEILGLVVTLIIVAISVTWLLANQINKNEKEILKHRIAELESGFNQFKEIMGQRIAVSEKLVEILKEKYTLEPHTFYQEAAPDTGAPTKQEEPEEPPVNFCLSERKLTMPEIASEYGDRLESVNEALKEISESK